MWLQGTAALAETHSGLVGNLPTHAEHLHHGWPAKEPPPTTPACGMQVDHVVDCGLYYCSAELSTSRGVLILPGLANNSADYVGLAQHLQDRGLAAKVVEVCPLYVCVSHNELLRSTIEVLLRRGMLGHT